MISTVPHILSPAEAWSELRNGNERFVAGNQVHANQGFDRRTEISVAQHPHTVLFGCSDSRVAAEIVFDQGLGDMFVVRTAGHVVDPTVLGSIEYGVEILDVPLIVVLGHDTCGAIRAATHALETGELPSGFVRTVVDRIMPTVAQTYARNGHVEVTDEVLRREHVRATVQTLQSYSQVLATAAAEGRCAIVGVEYKLANGRASVVEVVGDIGQEPDPEP